MNKFEKIPGHRNTYFMKKINDNPAFMIIYAKIFLCCIEVSDNCRFFLAQLAGDSDRL